MVTVKEFKNSAEVLPDEETERRINLVRAYNTTIEPSLNGIADPFSSLQKEGIKEYARMLEINEQIGYVSVPKLLIEIPIYAGTSESVLHKGAGHLESTSLPVGGEGTNTVITAHRGLPTARLFTDLDKMEKGDVFYIRNIKETLAYRVTDIKTVEPQDISTVRIEEGEDLATLLTCTPYMVNSHRLLVTGERMPYTDLSEETDTVLYNIIYPSHSYILSSVQEKEKKEKIGKELKMLIPQM